LLVGPLTIAEHWALTVFDSTTSFEQSLRDKVHFALKNGAINDRWIPNEQAVLAIAELKPGAPLYFEDNELFRWNAAIQETNNTSVSLDAASLVSHPTDLFRFASQWIASKADLVISNWALQSAHALDIPSHVTLIGDPGRIWIHPDAKLTACTLNATDGIILIAPGVEVQEGAHLRGPLSISEDSIVKMGARIYGATVIGPSCRIGGEISNCVFTGFSNKGHDGFLGQSVIGKWCNLGADTNSSNLKSNYANVRVWSESKQRFEDSGLQFCGLLMGDHSKSGINTMFNTGSTVGAGCNIFGGGFQPKHIPSFSWGGGDDWALHSFDKFIETAERVMSRRGQSLSETEIEVWRQQHELATLRFQSQD
jgi:UDP-N-acetylglucosamine diphosphorylase/glucosamine-1-phosphate N-acetyltransferase